MSAPAETGELRALLRLAWPLVIGHTGQQLMGVVDAAVLGHYGKAQLAGVGIGNGILFTVGVGGVGLIMGLDSLVPQALGAGQPAEARRLFRAGLRIAAGVGLPMLFIIAGLALLLPHLGVDREVAEEARAYLFWRLPATVPFLYFVAQRSLLQAHGATRALVVAMVFGNLVNFGADLVLVFGDPGLAHAGLPTLGLPPLGVIGSALATTSVSIAATLICGVAVRRVVKGTPALVPDRAQIRRVLELGWPIALQLVFEVGVFALTGVLAGNLGQTPAAAHQVALTLASLSFAIALGIGAAASVRVGRFVGAGDSPGARRAGFLAMRAGFVVMGTSALIFATVPEVLARLLTDDPEVVRATVPLLRIAAVFQLSDGLQAVASGALRGAGDNRATFLANLVGHYAIGLPIAIVLCFGVGLGAPGLWWGLTAGLTATAGFLALRFHLLSRRPIAPAIAVPADVGREAG